MYYIVPIILKKPIWSHGLSLVGFWGLAFFYPLQGIHHFLYTPIPMFLQYGAIISTIAVEFVVATVVINFIGTIWGDSRQVITNIPLRWFYTGMIFYFITCFQCALQVTLTFQKLIHFTDWVVGHAHLVMFGCVQHVAVRHDDLFVSEIATSSVAQPAALRVALLAFCRWRLHHVSRLGAGRCFFRVTIGHRCNLGTFQ